jgi:hypothetical protein
LGKWTVNVIIFETLRPCPEPNEYYSHGMDFSYDHVWNLDLSVPQWWKTGLFEIETQAGVFKTRGWDINNEITADC